MKRKLTALLLSLLLLCGCSEEVEKEDPVEEESTKSVLSQEVVEQELLPLNLACGRDFELLHPAKRRNADEANVPLLYESLVGLTEEYQWCTELASHIEKDGTDYIITLREGAVFSDGSTIRASDVVNSLYAAMESGSHWQSRLSVVQEAAALTAGKLRISITEPRQDFENLLTFPVAKEQNDGSWLGSGEYCLSEDGTTLVKNPNYQGEADGPDTIALTMLPNSETLLDSLKIDKVNCIFDDLSCGEAMNLSEQSEPVEIGHLVFLGANGEDGLAASAELRRAISGVIDRQVLADRVYSSKAKTAETPFHPDYYRITDYEPVEMNMAEARALLEMAGFTKDAEGYYGNEEADSLRLLYNSENAYRQQMAEMLSQQMNHLGLKVELFPLPYEEYMDALEDGQYDLYIGELAIDESMDIRRLFTRGKGYGYGVSDNSLLTVYQSYQQGNASAELFLSVYEKNMPAIPLLYRQGILIYGSSVEAQISSEPSRAFADIQMLK